MASELSVELNYFVLTSHNLIKLFLGGFTEDHPCIESFWRVVSQFSDTQKRQLLKFVTSCSRPPLLGFKVGSLSKTDGFTTCSLHSLFYSLVTAFKQPGPDLIWACDPIEKAALGQRSISKTEVTSMTSTEVISMTSNYEPTIRSRDTGQQKPCFFQLLGM